MSALKNIAIGVCARPDPGLTVQDSNQRTGDERVSAIVISDWTAVEPTCVQSRATVVLPSSQLSDVYALKSVASSVCARPDLVLTVQDSTQRTDAEQTLAMVKLDWSGVEQPCVQL